MYIQTHGLLANFAIVFIDKNVISNKLILPTSMSASAYLSLN